MSIKSGLRRVLGGVVALLLLCGLFAGTAAAQVNPQFNYKGIAMVGPNLTPGGYSNINNEGALAAGFQRCIGIDATGWAGLWNCTGNPDQEWDLFNPVVATRTVHFDIDDTTATNWTWYQLQNSNANPNQHCLGVDSGYTSVGARIRSWSCGSLSSNPDQWWAWSGPDSAGNYYLINYKSGLVVGVLGASTSNGAELVQWTFTTTPNRVPNQQWF